LPPNIAQLQGSPRLEGNQGLLGLFCVGSGNVGKSNEPGLNWSAGFGKNPVKSMLEPGVGFKILGRLGTVGRDGTGGFGLSPVNGKSSGLLGCGLVIS